MDIVWHKIIKMRTAKTFGGGGGGDQKNKR